MSHLTNSMADVLKSCGMLVRLDAAIGYPESGNAPMLAYPSNDSSWVLVVIPVEGRRARKRDAERLAHFASLAKSLREGRSVRQVLVLDRGASEKCMNELKASGGVAMRPSDLRGYAKSAISRGRMKWPAPVSLRR